MTRTDKPQGRIGGKTRTSFIAPSLARQLRGGKREGREQPQLAYIHRFPMLARRRSKLEAETSGLNDVVEEIVQGGCNKRKAEMIEKDLDNMEEQLDKYTKLYDRAVEELPEEERGGAIRDRDASYANSEN